VSAKVCALNVKRQPGEMALDELCQQVGVRVGGEEAVIGRCTRTAPVDEGGDLVHATGPSR
jgi:hypothetical protein